MSKINLQTVGFSAKFAEEAASFGCFPVGRVSAQYKDLYRVITETGEVLAEVSGKLRFNATALSDFPAVGDFVVRNNDSTNPIIKLFPVRNISNVHPSFLRQIQSLLTASFFKAACPISLS